MPKPKLHRLGDLQLRILQTLWEREEASVAAVHAALTKERLAHTTIATMLRKMEARGLVAHRAEGRTFLYRAAVAAEHVNQGMADHVLDRLFEGRLADMVSHLLDTREVSKDELAELQRLVAKRRRTV